MLFLNETDGSPALWEIVYGTGFCAQHRLKTATCVNRIHWTNNARKEAAAIPV